MITLSPVYHGTNKRFKEFSNSDSLTWFTSDKKYAKGFTSKKEPHIIEAEITISNPLILGNIDRFEKEFNNASDFYSKCLSPIAKTVSIDNDCNIDEVLAELMTLYSNTKKAGCVFELTNSKSFKDFLIKYNYDGVLAEETEVETYGVVDSKQIKILNTLKEELIKNVYHGTPFEFSRFDSMGNSLIWFTPNIEYATEYSKKGKNGTIKKCNITIDKMLDLGSIDEVNITEDYGKYMGDNYPYSANGDPFSKQFVRIAKKLGYKTEEQMQDLVDECEVDDIDFISTMTNTERFKEILQKAGYDGVCAIEIGKYKTYGVVSNKQVKEIK